MSAFPNPIEPHHVDPSNSPHKKHLLEHRSKWYADVLETARALAGLPVLVSLFLEVFKPEIKLAGAVAAFVIALILRFFPKVRRAVIPRKGHVLWSALPWFLSSILALVLVYKIIPARSKESATFLTRTWLNWQEELEQASDQCTESTNQVDAARKRKSGATDAAVIDRAMRDEETAEKARDSCLSKTLAPLLDLKHRPGGGMTSELMAGQLLLTNRNTSQALWDRMSIDNRFLGEGFSLPSNADPTAARVPEYLVRNIRDDSPEIWHWEIDQGTRLNQRPVQEVNLLQVLESLPPKEGQDFRKSYEGWMQEHLRPDSQLPLLVRFAMLDTPSSGCIGRPDASRVFMSNFGELQGKTLASAALSTGYIKNVKAAEKGVKIHVWVYAPTEADEVSPATWGSALSNFDTWITQDPCAIKHVTSN
jgi:hypothetical protein